MSQTRTARITGAAALAVAVAVGSVAHAAPRSHVKPGPNLVLNPGFEESALEGPAAPPGSLAQPVLPTAWSFEGLTVLFDHTPNVYRSGKRAAAISGSLSGPDKVCPQPPTCVDNPTKPVKDQLAPQYTLAPHWRTAAAVPVTEGTEYALTAWVRWTIVTLGEGASMKIRWMSGSSPISEDINLKRSDAGNNLDLPFTEVTFKAKAPAGANGAVILLGQTDDAWNGQVVYDDVYFGTAGHR